MNQENTQVAKVALVTGAARRVGAAISRRLHQAGYRIAIHCYRSLAAARTLADELNCQRPNSACVFKKELSTPHASFDLVTAVYKWSGRLDLLINNASLFTRTNCDWFDEPTWEALFTANVKVPFLLSLAARPYLAANEGAIINITDIHADKPLRDYAVYCQSKAALVMQTKALAREFAPSIRVNAIAPGAIMWPEGENKLDVETQQSIISKTPLGQHGNPNFIAQAVLALVENTFITGQILNVDGGRSLN